MIVRRMSALLLVCLATLPEAQDMAKETPISQAFNWPPGKHCAISLTFDDARLSQIDFGIPLLNSYGIKATFYISPDNLLQRLDGWRAAAATGHEIGNHTMTHPCTGNYAFSRDNALENYTLSDIKSEIKRANEFILLYLGVEPTGFAYPCGQKFVGAGEKVRSYVPVVAKQFRTGRSWLDEGSNDPLICDPAQLLAMESDGKSFESLKALVDKAASEGRWLILAGHEMNDSGYQTTLLSCLDELCRYMQNPENGIWVDTVDAVAQYVLQHR